MPYYKKFAGVKCFLSPCQPQDAEKWAEWFNDLQVTLPLGDEAYIPSPLDKMKDEVSQMIQNQDHVFSIVDLATDQLIGRCLLFNLDWVNRSAMLGILIGEKSYWNHGYGQEAVELLLDYAFNLLNLHSVMLGTFSFNTPAIRCYQKIGFKEIGRRRQARIIAAQKYDVILMDMLANEYKIGKIGKIVGS